MADSWWVIVPQGDASQPASYLEQVDFRVQFQPGSAEYDALQARNPISYDGVTWVYWQGPFATEAQAQAAQNPQAAPNPQQAAGRVARGAAGALTSALTGQLQVSGIAGWFLRGLKMLFGGVLLLVGVMHLTGSEDKLAKLAGAAGKGFFVA